MNRQALTVLWTCIEALVLASVACKAPDRVETGVDEDAGLVRMTLDQVLWSNDERLPPPLRKYWRGEEPTLLAHVVEWEGFEKLRGFTARADKRFLLEAPGHPTIHARAGTGGVTSSDGRIRFVLIFVHAQERIAPGVEYTLVPRNEIPGATWIVPETVRAVRSG